jgi:hypothetical protein
MQKARITVSVTPDVLEAAEAQVAHGAAASLSAWVEQAMAEKADRDGLDLLLADMRAEIGPVSPEADAWARAVLGL